ncbi:MAG: glycosyltransferase family 1 protein [Flavobacterium sp.]|nr:MAG: glycosyltransferase family 1 protein [Flavobacterium sp.]
MNILFLTLNTYSLVGGIEKVCAVLVDVFAELLGEQKIKNSITLSFHDEATIDVPHFKSYQSKKVPFSLAVFRESLKADVIILSHINLLIFARLIKQISPSKRIIMLAHGIEVWKPLSLWKKRFLNKVEIWAVSSYTAKQMQKLHHLTEKKILVLPNGLPKDFVFASLPKQPTNLLAQYGVEDNQPIILTVCRLSTAEKYKGYDLVILALKAIVKLIPNFRYFIIGKADELEAKRVKELIGTCGLTENIILTGYVSDQQLAEFYQNATIFAMPSKGEGFGLVFIEAVAQGCTVLAGNKDGSIDALLNGQLGELVDPEDGEAIYQSLLKLLNEKMEVSILKQRQDLVNANFGFERYKFNVAKALGVEVQSRKSEVRSQEYKVESYEQ